MFNSVCVWLSCPLTPSPFFSSVSVGDQPPGCGDRRRLRHHLGAARHLHSGQVLQEEAHGQRHRAALPGARVEGRHHVVRAGDKAVHLVFLLGLVWSLIGSWVPLLFWKRKKKGRKRAWKASFYPCLLLSRELSFLFLVIATVLHTP